MPTILTVNGKTPTMGHRCYIADNATVAGNVAMGDDCSVWFSAVVRADVDSVVMGDRVNVQDCACIHQTAGSPVVLGNDVSIGHGAVVHACTIRDGALVGMNATVLDKAEIGEGAIVAAGAVVLQGTKIPPYEIWAGIPAKCIKKTRDGQAETFAQHYMDIKKWYLK